MRLGPHFIRFGHKDISCRVRNRMLDKIVFRQSHVFFLLFFFSMFSLNIFYFQQITSYTVQYIQFKRKLGLERKRKLIEFFSYYRLHCDMEGGLYHVSYQFVVNMITH